MGWAALGKAAGGMLKGGAKKIATNKFLGRGKKKPQKPQAGSEEQEKGGALAIRPTTSLMPIGPTAIVPSPGGDLATTGGKVETPEEILLNINTKIIRVDRLLKGSFAIREKQRQDAKKQAELDENKKEEAALEKKKPKGAGKFKIPGVGKAKSLIGSIVKFITTIFLGYWAVRLVDWLPKIAKWAPVLGKWIDTGLDALGWVVDGLSTVIKLGYDFVGKMEGWVKNVFGEEGAEKFRTFMGNLKDLIAGFLVWKIIGEKIFKAIVGAIKNVWKTITKAIRTVWVKLRRLVGRHVRKFFGKLVQRAGGALKNVGQGILNVGKNVGQGIFNVGKRAGAGILNVGKNVVGRVGGLFGRGASTGVGKTVGTAVKTAGKVASKVGGWATKLFGKAAGVIAPALKGAMPAIKGFAKRIPIFGSLIVGIISLMSGEPLGQALFKMIGAAVGGALGTFIPIPIIGTMLGEIVGAFVGDLLYYTIVKRDPKKAVEVLKQAVGGIFRGGKAVFNFVTGGFGRFFEGIPKIKIPNFPEDPPGIMKRVPFAGKVWKGLKVAMKVMLGPIGLLMGKEIPNLLWMYNPANTGPLLVKSFFPPSGEESSGKSAPLEEKPEEKQEKKLLATNQKSGAQGVIDSISNRASYEDPTPTTVKVSPSGGFSGKSDTGEGSSTATIIPVVVGGGHDAYEPLDFFG